MAETTKRLSHEDHANAQRIIGLLTDGSTTVNKTNKAEYATALTEYQEQVKAQLEAPNPEQAQCIERLASELDRIGKELAAAQSDGNPRVVELQKQIEELNTKVESGTQHQTTIEQLEAEVSRLSKAAEEHPRQIEDITKRANGEAEKVEALQRQMQCYQEVALEVANLPQDQAENQLQSAKEKLEVINRETPEDEANKAVLTHKIALLEAKQKEHLAIQQKLQKAPQPVITATEQETAGNAQLLQDLLVLVPEHSQGESYTYLQNAVKAIVEIQGKLHGLYPSERVAHAGIGELLQDIYRLKEEYRTIINQVIHSTGAYDGVAFYEAKVQLAGYVEQLERKKAEMERLIDLPQGEIQGELERARLDSQRAIDQHGILDAPLEGERNKDAIAKALYDVQFHELRVQVLRAIQAQHHQPLINAHAAHVTSLELKNRLLVALQGLTGGLLRTLVSIPSTLISGLQTMGNPIVKKPDSR